MTNDHLKTGGDGGWNDPTRDLEESLPPAGGIAELSDTGDVRTALSAKEISFAPGDLLANRFRIIRFISKGGMGEVYEAKDVELGENVAVKTVLPSIARSPAAIDLFKREIQLARKVTHPNVCRIFDLVYDVRPSGPVAFLTMELLDGVTLSSRIESKGSLSLQESLALARQMAEGLNAAHRAGVVHQDFKPGNVILADGADGLSSRAVITDFGLAHNMRAADLGPGKTAGTPVYMAPEQIEAGKISAATDVYALGIVLYELVTGRWPYNARTIEELQAKKLSQAPVPPSRYMPDLPVRVDRAILKCLARKPEDRFRSALEVVEALAPPRRRWPLMVTAALVVTAVAGIGGYEWRRFGTMSAEPTVAVMGFKNISGDSNYDWLSSELSERLTTELGGSHGVQSVPMDEVSNIKTELSVAQNQSLEGEDLSTVRQALGANFLLLGRYVLASPGTNLDMNVLLQDSRGAKVAEIHEIGSAADYRKLVGDAASQIRERLGKTKLSDTQVTELQNLYPVDPSASRLYFQALNRLRSFDAAAALTLLQQASEIDPNNVSIHWGLADAWSQLRHDKEAAQEAQKASTLAEGASLPREYVVLAQARAAEASKQWEAAIENYKSLYALFPSHLNYGLSLASVQIDGSKATDALATLNKLAKLPPPMGSDPRIEMTKAKGYGSLNDYASELRAAQLALQEAKNRNARLMQARAHLALCWANRNLGHLEEAYSSCNEAQNLFSVFGDNVSAAVALNDVATWLSDRGRLAEAKQLYDRVIQVNRAAGARKDLAGACVNVAIVLNRMGKPDEAEDYIKQALDAALPIADKNDEALARILRGEVLAKQGHALEAEGEVQRALTLAREIGNRSTEATALLHLAEYQSETDTGRAISTYRVVLDLRRKKGDQPAIATCLMYLGNVFMRGGNLSAAQHDYSEALAIDSQLKDKSGVAFDLMALAEVDFERGDLHDAREKSLQAIKQFHDNEDADNEEEASSVLVRVLVAHKDIEEAAAHVQRIEQIASTDPETKFDGRLSLAEYLAAIGKREEAIQQVAPVPSEAKGAGMNFLSLQARLELVQLTNGRRPAIALRKELSAIQAEARRAGFGLLLQKSKRIQIGGNNAFGL